MEQRLSTTSLGGPLAYLGGCLLLAIVCLWAGQQQPAYDWAALGCQLLLVLHAPRCGWYQVSLTAGGLRLERLFTQPLSYPLADFVALQATTRAGHPVRLTFADGRSFLLQPKLKESALALRYEPVADFMEYWTARLQEPARFAGQHWPDDRL